MEKFTGKIIVILGPTSSGKSNIAIKLAKKFNGEIISADSRQIYRGMDIGTGKVSKEEQKIIKHWALDIVSPKTEYNAAKFKKYTDKIITDILKRGKVPIICGGTGFWIKSIVDNVVYPKVKPDFKLRKELNKKSAEKLFSLLKKLDPERSKTIDAKNKVRLIRAIEICKSLGKVPVVLPPRPLTGEGGQGPGEGKNYQFLQIDLKLSKEKLYANIKKRLKKRFEAGMIEEVKKLKESGLSWKKIQSFGLGYFWIPKYIQKEISRKECFEKIYQAEKNYAKRQMIWFKKDKRILWLEKYQEIEKEIRKFLS